MIRNFYLNGGKDIEGRTFQEMLDMDDEQLETSHDIVQWLFPLNEESAYNEKAPVLNDDDILALRLRRRGSKQYFRAVYRFLDFYGMKSACILGLSPDDKILSRWLYEDNHNLKRITRIIRCGKLLNCQNMADKVLLSFMKLRMHPLGAEAITHEVIDYWLTAATAPIELGINQNLSK